MTFANLLALGAGAILLISTTAAEARHWNPPGPAGGPGTNWRNPPGPVGGPGASRYRWNPPGPVGGPGRGAYWAYRAPVRAYYGYPRYAYPRGHLCRYDRDNNPPGPRGGRGTNWENPPGWRGGPGASPNSPFRPC